MAAQPANMKWECWSDIISVNSISETISEKLCLVLMFVCPKKDLKEAAEIWRNPARVILGIENLL